MKDTQLSGKSLEIVNAAYKKLKSIQAQKTESIAIVGMSCRFPQANDVDSYWQVLVDNVDTMSKTPSDRYNIDLYHSGQSDDLITSAYGGYISDVYDFDAGFFDLSPKEVLALDPQQRLLLEVAVEALENANQPIDKLSNVKTSVYIGISSFDYGVRLQSNEDKINSYLGTGTLLSPSAGRLSYFLNLNGPSMVIDTACSSSLVAIHQAAMSLRNGESDISIVGGVGLILEPNLHICFSKANMLSPDGRCKTFDDSADGYVRGEGCAVIILKRLSDAIKNKDNILGVIRGSAVNQDGASGGLTIPSGPSQKKVIQQALLSSNVKADEVDYVEAHGTGTSLGDPIEIHALGEVFRDRSSKLQVGSVKTNIGHLEACSGLASVIKVILAMHHSVLPASLHFNKPNSRVAWNDLAIEVISKNTPWLKNDKKRIAGVSSFGFSGTNAHVIVEEAPESSEKLQQQMHGGVLTISAKDRVSLLANMQKLQVFLQNKSDSIENVCFTSNVGRGHYKDRIALVIRNEQESLEKVNQSISFLHKKTADISNFYISGTQNDIKTAYIFPGMQNTDKNICIHMYKCFQHHPYFQNILTKCKDIIISNNWITEQEWNDLLKQKNATTVVLNLVTLSIHYALAKLISYIGIKPKVVIGQGMGEYVAAGVAGIFSLEDMLYLIYNRTLKKDDFSVLLTMVTVKKTLSLEYQGSSSNPHKVNNSDYWNFHFNQVDISEKIIEKYDCSLIIGSLSLIQENGKIFTVIGKNNGYIENSLPLIVAYFYSQGVDLIWDRYHQGINYQRVNLPTYAWNKKKYMIENKNKQQNGYSIVQNNTIAPATGVITFDCRIALEKLSYISDHKIFGKIIFPESTYLEMFIEASNLLSNDKDFSIENIELLLPYIFTDKGFVHMQLICTPKESLSYNIELISLDDSGKSITHVKGKVMFAENSTNKSKQDLFKLKSNFSLQPEINIESYYQDFVNTGVEYGSNFRCISKASLLSDKSEMLGFIESKNNFGKFCLNPIIVDGCLQLIAALLDKNDNKSTYFIMSIGSVQYYDHGQQQDKIWCHIVKQVASQNPVFDLELLDDEGNLVAKIEGLKINYGNESSLLLNKTKDWFYNMSWNESISNFTDNKLELGGTWLILSDGGDSLANELKINLKNNGAKCIDMELSSNNYKNTIKEIDEPIQGVIFALGSDKELNNNINNTVLQLCSELLSLVQSLGTVDTRLCVITQKVHGDTEVRPQQSVLWGMGRVILLEHPNLKPIFIDYDYVFDGLSKNVLLDILYEDNENQVLYKKRLRYNARLQYEHIIQNSNSYRIDPNAAYLITGAFGALGLRISQLLVDRGARHLILVSRRGAATEHAKDVVKAFKKLGVEVNELKLDISQQDTIDQLKVPLRGVIHTAGVLDDKLLSNQTKSSFNKVLAPKVQGSWNLHQLTKDQNLDFFVCFSSMTSVIGAMGQGNYAAANYFMDVLCHYRRSKNLPAISISWGPWAGAGMGAKKDLIKHWANMGMGTIDLDEGVMIFEKLLHTDYSHIGVMPTDWSKYPDKNSFLEILKEPKKQENESEILLELRKADLVQRRKILVQYVEAEICEILGYELGKQSFEEDQGFFELGMNSLSAIEFKNKLQDRLDCQLSSTLTFDYPTIAKLVNYLDLEIVSIETEDDQEDITIETIQDNDEDIIKKLSEQLGI
jgi:acyl transferase domain-containing protein/acyl carrier protein